MCFELECREKKVSALQSFCSREIERERERRKGKARLVWVVNINVDLALQR
jgi:hypothetical protein